MRLYIELYFSSEGVDPIGVVRELKELGFEPVIGDYDVGKEYNTPAEYNQIVKNVVKILQGTKVRYRLITRKN
ncbi:MAG: hypothetical protein R6U17_07235 [Thermoplasmata archaeon]